jgi:2-amino-4-hydroxy-6-hydroxymethyldihydropteridine diphosphokinase
MSEILAYLGLGTNLGDRYANLRAALSLLEEEPGLRLLRCSQVYVTEPWGVTDQPRFLNCAAEVATTLSPEELLARCKEVEGQLGRLPGPRWGPRLLDVDILLYGDQKVDLPHLEIPHPRLHLRAFALTPLAELVPAAVHPWLAVSIGDLAADSEGRDGVRPLGSTDLALGCSEC